MAGSQIDSHYQPGQACRFKNYDGISAVSENTFFQGGQSFWCGLEAKAITGLCSLVQAARPVSSLV
jgi:hypothetical protein